MQNKPIELCVTVYKCDNTVTYDINPDSFQYNNDECEDLLVIEKSAYEAMKVERDRALKAEIRYSLRAAELSGQAMKLRDAIQMNIDDPTNCMHKALTDFDKFMEDKDV